MEQDDGFGFQVWGVTEVEDVAIGAEAADDRGSGRGGDGLPLGADGDFAVVAHAHAGLLAPGEGPPRALGGGAHDGTFFGQRLLLGSARGLAQFAVDFVLIGVRDKLVQELVGAGEFEDAFGICLHLNYILP